VNVRSRRIIILLAVLVAAAGTRSVGAPTASAATELQPDLGMARLHSFRITNQYGKRLLRFGTDVVNVGAGPFDVISNGSANAEWPWATQRIFDDAGGSRDWAVDDASVFYSGDGHNHRHLRDLLTMELAPRDNTTNVVGRIAKIGYCFYDNVRYRLSLPRAPQSVVYRSSSCGNSSSTSVRMGLSVGWGDRYPWDIAYQYINITGLAPGNYRLTVTADKQGWFEESNNNNNFTWTDLYIARPGYSSRILGYGPSA
jgi:hypothetical protein